MSAVALAVTRATSLNDAIASRTRALHDQNNRLANLRLVGALRSGILWREYLLGFAVLYTAIEDALDHVHAHSTPTRRRVSTSDPIAREPVPGRTGDVDADDASRLDRDAYSRTREAIRQIWHPMLARRERILDDLTFFYCNDRASATTHVQSCRTTNPAARSYAEHIAGLVDRDPVRLLAYLSVMYLALFAGGRIIRSRMNKTMGFYPRMKNCSREDVLTRGIHVLTFDLDRGTIPETETETDAKDPELTTWQSHPRFPDATALKTFYRAHYDRVAGELLTDAERERVILEACEIFRRNDALISSVAEASDATWRGRCEFATHVLSTIPLVTIIPVLVALFGSIIALCLKVAR